MRNLTVLFLVIVFCIGCQEEGEPLTVETINELNPFNASPFKAFINGSELKGTEISGIRTNGQVAITALIEGNTFVIATEELDVGIYLGAANPLKNYVTFQNSSGTVFSSTKQGENSNIIIDITKFDEARRLISGTMKGTLYAPWNESVNLTNGRFNNVLVETPFEGEMNAKIGSVNFSSATCINTTSTVNGIILDLVVASANSDSLSLSMTIEEKLRVKQYDFNNQKATARYNSNTFSSNVFKHQYTSTSGSLNITSVDTTNNKIEGNFQFNAENLQGNTIQITGGDFKALMK